MREIDGEEGGYSPERRRRIHRRCGPERKRRNKRRSRLCSWDENRASHSHSDHQPWKPYGWKLWRIGDVGRAQRMRILDFVEERCGKNMGFGGYDGGGRANEEEVVDDVSGRSAEMEEGGIENEGIPRFADALESNQGLDGESWEYMVQDDFIWGRIHCDFSASKFGNERGYISSLTSDSESPP
ncbi:uncharacterized protein G2W53_040282 [Senna tora]|uniref:Uncharacterized protein n=1 Tax=Senna tora TaxID=362788 RepID=A0A834SRD8_9FABA|nr:uncharacterized protein G2W53_040282 [Senna tora]